MVSSAKERALEGGETSHGGPFRWRALAVTAYLALTVCWASALVWAPYVLSHAERSSLVARAASEVYVAGSVICHQRPERSFFAFGLPLPVCARCSGLYFAAPLGALWAVVVVWLRRRHATPQPRSVSWRVVLGVAAAPMAVAVGVEWLHLADVSGVARAATALPLGLAVSWLVADSIAASVRE